MTQLRMRYELAAISSASLCIVLLCAGPSAAQTNTLTVRVINARNVKPLRNAIVYLNFDKDYPRVDANAPAPVKAKTGVDGSAVFTLTPPIPDKMFFAVPAGDRLCSEFGYSTQLALEYGVVGTTRYCDTTGKLDGKLRDAFSAKPGQVVLFVKPYTLWELFKREF